MVYNYTKSSATMFDIFISAANIIFPRFLPQLVTQCFVYYNERPAAVNEINSVALKDVGGHLHMASLKNIRKTNDA